MSAAILVGSLVRVARPVGGGPVNREGYTGKVLDIAGDRHGREALVDYGLGPDAARWVPMRYLVPAETGEVGEKVIEGFGDRMARAGIYKFGEPPIERIVDDGNRLVAERATVAEPEGHDAHLDAIEARLAVRPADRPSSIELRSDGGIVAVGTVSARPGAYIPKGGA